jgi:plasmid stabilization system protein ParE
MTQSTASHKHPAWVIIGTISLGARHRFWTVYSYVIVYRENTARLEIIAIVHGARHLEAFLQHRAAGQASEAAE